MTVTMYRTVVWGDALGIECFKHPRGLQHVVQVIRREVGDQIGTRNTFAKLMRVESPESLNSKDLYRAWLLLSALGHDPADWGVGNETVPASVDGDRLQAKLASLCAARDSNPEPADIGLWAA